jgi:hypothetical protein
MTKRTTLINGHELTLTVPDGPMAGMDLAVAEILLELAAERRTLELEISEEVREEIERAAGPPGLPDRRQSDQLGGAGARSWCSRKPRSVQLFGDQVRGRGVTRHKH